VNNAKKRCAGCSKKAGNDVMHSLDEFGPQRLAKDGLKPTCRKALRIRDQIARGGTAAETRTMLAREKRKAEIRALIEQAEPGSRGWFRKIHKFDHSIMSGDDMARQKYLLSTWR
jgi:hypothetical protein